MSPKFHSKFKLTYLPLVKEHQIFRFKNKFFTRHKYTFSEVRPIGFRNEIGYLSEHQNTMVCVER
jgi:hypothetical protein